MIVRTGWHAIAWVLTGAGTTHNSICAEAYP
jgi:hypothetical protein